MTLGVSLRSLLAEQGEATALSPLNVAGFEQAVLVKPVGARFAGFEQAVLVRPAVASPMSAYATAVLADSPVAYWPLGESSGTTASDLVGSHDGAYSVSAPPTAPALVANVDGDLAGDFDGTSDHWVDISGVATESLATTGSIEMWVEADDPSPTSPQSLCELGNSATSSEFIGVRFQSNGNLAAVYRNAGVNHTVETAVDGTAHHVVMTWDANDVHLYVDNSEVGAGTARGADVSNLDQAAIAAKGQTSTFGGQFYFDGRLDEVAIYDVTLTPTQVSDHYAAGTP